mgnify:CR=1 FL=1
MEERKIYVMRCDFDTYRLLLNESQVKLPRFLSNNGYDIEIREESEVIKV